jgi:hypothetical protein
MKGLDAFTPAEFTGPVSDRGGIFAEDLGDGQKRAGLAELKKRVKGDEGARGFAGQAKEGWWRVENRGLRGGGRTRSRGHGGGERSGARHVLLYAYVLLHLSGPGGGRKCYFVFLSYGTL